MNNTTKFVMILLFSIIIGMLLYLLFERNDAKSRLSDKLPPGAKKVEYTDSGSNSSVVFDLHDRTFLMWYSRSGGTRIVEITKKR